MPKKILGLDKSEYFKSTISNQKENNSNEEALDRIKNAVKKIWKNMEYLTQAKWTGSSTLLT